MNIVKVDFQNAQHIADLKQQITAYSLDPMGGGKALTPEVLERSVALLEEKDYANSLLCYVDGKAAGFVNFFENISSFAGRLAINIHDIAVLPEYRGQGIAKKLLAAVEEHARAIKACKITLEVLEGNVTAQKAYKSFGFGGYQLQSEFGNALFWQKNLTQ